MKNLLILTCTLLAGTLPIFAQNNNDQQHGKPNDFAQVCEKLDKAVNSVNTQSTLELMIAEKKLQLIRDLNDGADVSPAAVDGKPKNSDDLLYVPKKPVELTAQEKTIDVYARISRNFVGEIPEQIRNMIGYFSNYEQCRQNNIDISNRLLLHGAPGTGKTHLFKVLAQELQLPSLSFSAAFFNDKYMGEASRKIRKAFDVFKKTDVPILIFIDEIDAIATTRQDSMHEENRGTLITLLTELQALQDNKNVFFIAATNTEKALDPAIKDRFAGSICEIKELTTSQRAKLLLKLFEDKEHVLDSKLAQTFVDILPERFSNRDLEYIVTATLLTQFLDCRSDQKKCAQNQLSSYFVKALIAINKI